MPPEIKSLRWRKFIAKYVNYLEIFAYAMIILVGTALVVAWTYKVEVTADSKDGDLKAHEYAIELDQECVIVRLPVLDKTDVKKGDVIAQVCTDADFIKRYTAMKSVRSALEGLQGMAASVTATPAEQALMEQLKADLNAWDAAEAPACQAVTATANGTLWLGPCTTGTVYAADKKIAGIRDFNLLEVSLAFETKNAHACLPGQPGYIEVNAEQTFETLIRLDTDHVPMVPVVGSRLSQFTTLADQEIRELIEGAIKNRLLLDRDKAKTEDFPLPVKDFKNVKVNISGKPEVGSPTGKATTTTILLSQDFRALQLDAVCIKGKHYADLTLLDLSAGEAAKEYVEPKEDAEESAEATPDASEEKPDSRSTEEKIHDLLRGHLLNRPISIGGETHHVKEELEGLVVNVKMSAELKDEDWDLEAWPEGYALEDLPDVADRAEGDEGTKHVKLTKRKFTGTLRLLDPDPLLKARVKQLALDGKALKVKGKLIVSRTPFAMMLFRKH